MYLYRMPEFSIQFATYFRAWVYSESTYYHSLATYYAMVIPDTHLPPKLIQYIRFCMGVLVHTLDHVFLKTNLNFSKMFRGLKQGV